MTDRVQPTEQQRREAADWLVRLNDEGADEAVAMDFADWLEGEAGRREAFDVVEQAFVDIEMADPATLSTVVPMNVALRRRTPRVWIGAGAVAAAAAVALMVGINLWSSPAPQVFETAAGQTKLITLADGSRIALGGGSRVDVVLRGRKRDADLERGEANFDVVHDPSRPFTVAAGEDRVRVLGTQFDVRRYSTGLTVSVSRGLVQVSTSETNAEPVLLPAGRELQRRQGQADKLLDVTPSQSSGWQAGRLVYLDKPLGEVAEDLSRYLPTPITVAPDAADLKVTGVLNVADEEAMVERLQTFLPVRATKTSSGIRLEKAPG